MGITRQGPVNAIYLCYICQYVYMCIQKAVVIDNPLESYSYCSSMSQHIKRVHVPTCTHQCSCVSMHCVWPNGLR